MNCPVNKTIDDDKFFVDKMTNLDTFLMSSPLNNSVYKYTGHVHVLRGNSSYWHYLFYLAEFTCVQCDSVTLAGCELYSAFQSSKITVILP